MKKIRLRVKIPIGIMDFRSEIPKSDQNFFLTFNYEKVPEKILST